MKRILRIGLMGLFLFALNAHAEAKVNFTGTWVLDQAKSTERFPGAQQFMVMAVAQTDDRLEVKIRIFGPQGEEQALSDLYVLNGEEAEFALPQAGVTGKGKRMSKWSDDGSGLDVAEQTDLDLPDGPACFKKMGKWSLSAKGKTLTIRTTFEGPGGVRESKLVFVKG